MGIFSSLSFLTPLYVAAGLAIGLPILFHLIRRTPRGRQVFSSVMFLTPSPPRVTRRSRIEDWLLLCLRGLAVLLIVAAFCRPLWRELLAGSPDPAGRELVWLIDASASMDRAGLWAEAQGALAAQLRTLQPTDRLTVLQFDDVTTPILQRPEWLELDPAQRLPVLRERLESLRPTGGGTALGRALLEAVDRLQQADAAATSVGTRRIVLISDLQAGSRWEELQGRPWPEEISVELVRVGAETPPTNAALHLVGRPESGDPPFVRLRVSNAANSQRETFQVGWSDPFGENRRPDPAQGIVEVYVPPGQSRVIRLPSRGGPWSTARAVLSGDDHPFDNTCYIAWPRRAEVRIVYLGPDAAADRSDMRFFVDPLFADTPQREVTIEEGWPAGDAAGANGTDFSAPASAAAGGRAPITLVIVTGALSVADEARVLAFLAGGGCVLFVCRDVESSAGLYRLAGSEPRPVQEASVADYVMLREVDFRHPVFAPLSDPRYSDLTKVHFWRHRTVDVGNLPRVRVLARFDDGDPALCESQVGAGRLFILTSGWNRSDSELATWSKFIPIMNALLALGAGEQRETMQLTVGDRLPWEMFAALRPQPRGMLAPDGSEIPWEGARLDSPLRQPGFYRLIGAESATESAEPASVLAVNLPVEESRTEPLRADVLESLGVRLAGDAVAGGPSAERSEQMARSELESRQKLWRWLLAAALGVLLLETLLAGRWSSLRSADQPA
jgi:hypothetical protein